MFTKFIFAYLIIACQSLYAVEVDDLFEAEITIKSEQVQNKEIAIQRALKLVLDRVVTGDSIFKENTINTLLIDAEHFVREFQYSLGEADTSMLGSVRHMRVLFDEKLLVSFLRLGKIGLWNEIRPRTLVWLVVEENGEQHFFDSDSMPEIDLALSSASKQKGLPMLYPMQDLKEKRGLSINDVLSVHPKQLLDASLRYDVVSTLAGKIVKKDYCWEAEWTFYFNSKIEQWRSECGEVGAIALTGFQGVYDKLSAFYAVKPDELAWLP